MMLRIVRLPQPVIAEVKGIATAAGCQLVASCDLAVAAEEARFATSGVNVGLFCSTPDGGAVAQRAAQDGDGDAADGRVRARGANGRDRAGQPRRAARHARARVDGLARSIAEKSPVAIRAGKRAFYEQAGCRWTRPTPIPAA